ncbi:PAS domain-containing protein [Bradyrhizobium ontarionense]|uniref:Blue-light-activated histidine kinase n=1 Tax=Bradyrhizobium ontarionense TaxID=2898149 RepID=A0ABY3R775_9BRAD|nr:HWE histidine kinase domain-containing protein [Bradyrhizobium sp. A19]UFZ03156.1 PAS domain-containing protein [Bradyrhizobium sp. A19]
MSEITQKSDRQKGAEAVVDGFRKDLGPFVVAAETTRMAMLFTDAAKPDNPIIFANDSLLALTGYGRDEVLGKEFNFLMADGSDAEALTRTKAEFAGSSGGGAETLCRRKDGSEFWAGLFVSPVRDADGNVVQYFVSLIDLTKHKDDEVRSRMLIDELNHRVKNTLSTVQSIVWQTLRTTTDPTEIRRSIESRLFALSRSHDLLTRERWESAGLFDIVRDALEPFGVSGGRADRIVITGENIRFPPKATLALGIAFNELATNAVKYGALSNAAGSILITWTAKTTPAGERLLLRWEENGGPPVTPPAHKGFGSRVLERGLAHELDGTVQLDYQPNGLICTIDIPLAGGAPGG